MRECCECFKGPCGPVGLKKCNEEWDSSDADQAAFYDHLDSCSYCREHPLILCADGELLRLIAYSL